MSKHKIHKTLSASPWPRLARGHAMTRDGKCSAAGCQLNGGKVKHIDPSANQKEWETAVGQRQDAITAAARTIAKVAAQQRRSKKLVAVAGGEQ